MVYLEITMFFQKEYRYGPSLEGLKHFLAAYHLAAAILCS